jgi:hypothetical protein
MAAEGSARAVVTALGANVGIAIAKFVAAAITGSTSMLAEGVHSVADSGNQVLLLIGGKRARQAPSTLHQFGYARARYIYAFLVAVVLFTLGGLYALYEGYHKITDPHPLTSPLAAGSVLYRDGAGGLCATHRGPRGQPHSRHPQLAAVRPPHPLPRTYDGIASFCIGVIAILLAREITSLLIGETALPEQV